MGMITLPSFFAFKEIWRNRGRFLLFSLVIALITVLVLFIAALGEGLGNGNREYLDKLDAQLVAYQERSELTIPISRIDRGQAAAIRRVPGVQDAGAIGTSSVALMIPEKDKPLRISLLGVEPGRPGEPRVVEGRQLSTDQAREAVIDRGTALRSGYKVGDTITIRSTQGTQDEFYDLRVVGLTDGQQYSLQPSIFTPFFTWDRVRPKSEAEVRRTEAIANVIAIKLSNPRDVENVKERLKAQVQKIDLATIQEAIENTPGYGPQQSTVNTQAVFTLLIGVLVIGGFFQIQVLQKVPQIGVLKAIGASNFTVGMASVLQIIAVTTMGVLLGGFGTFLLSLTFPPTVPIVFNGQRTLMAVGVLMLIGPIGGLVSVRYAIRIEPLRALGLSS